MLSGWLNLAGFGKGKKDKEKGKAPPAAPTRWGAKEAPAQSFDKIHARGNVVVHWTRSELSCVATVDLDDPASELLSVSWEGGVANIVADPSAKSPARVVVASPSLSGFACEGLASGSAHGIDAEVFEASVEDGASLELAGTAVAAKLRVHGVGKLLADRLIAHAVYAAVESSGLLEAKAEAVAEVAISGGGEAMVFGNPRVAKVDRKGSGRAQIGTMVGAEENPLSEGIFGQLPIPKS